MSMRERVGHDHHCAAATASFRQHLLEENAQSSKMSVEQFLRMSGLMPVTDYRCEMTVTKTDLVDADYLRAARYATSRQEMETAEAAAERRAIESGMTVEEYESWAKIWGAHW